MNGKWKLFGLICGLAMLVGCATTASTAPVVACTEEDQIMRSAYDGLDTALVWMDLDCDGECDTVLVVIGTKEATGEFSYELAGEVSCEDADEIWERYQSMNNVSYE